MGIELRDHQKIALRKMKNGCILCGGVGSGKSITSIAYYFQKNGGDFGAAYLQPSEGYVPMSDPPQDLYIITTARKRDNCEWNLELARFLIAPGKNTSIYYHTVVIDSWNNINKYIQVKNAFFIFDEQRLKNTGAWSKAFLKIAANNDWIMLSATPGDTWKDYIPVFIANGFYKNKTEFIQEHENLNPHVSYPQIMSYRNVAKLERLRDRILVDMPMERHTVRHEENIVCEYDEVAYKDIMKNRWNYDEQRPIESSPEFCYQLRKCVNQSEDKSVRILELFENHPRMIIFYNYDYELQDLKAMFEFMSYDDCVTNFAIAEWNGHAHQEIPDTESWVYLCQYTSSCEGWNCTKTDTVVFYSLNYSWSVMEQAKGRIDRLNTGYTDLYYYSLITYSSIDNSIRKALKTKKKFQEAKFAKFTTPIVRKE